MLPGMHENEPNSIYRMENNGYWNGKLHGHVL